jgi:hypothetical protein
MKGLAGAVLVLAAAILLGAATVARAIVEAANKPSNADGAALFAAVVVGLIGFILLMVGLAIDSIGSRRE